MDAATIAELCSRISHNTKGVDHALEQLEAIRLGLFYWHKRRFELILYLRSQGVTWKEMADTLEVTPSAVYQRFKRSPFHDA